MGLFTAAESLAGLDLGSSAVKVVELRRVRAGFELVRAGLEPLEPEAVDGGSILDPDSVAEAIRRVFTRNRIRTKKVATSVSGRSVIVKKLTLPAASLQELDESIQWEARQVIPFDLSDVQLDYQVLESASAGGDAEVLLVAARKERVSSHLGVIARAGRSPLILDVDGFALQNAYEANYRPGSSVTAALLHSALETLLLEIGKSLDLFFWRLGRAWICSKPPPRRIDSTGIRERGMLQPGRVDRPVAGQARSSRGTPGPLQEHCRRERGERREPLPAGPQPGGGGGPRPEELR